MGVARRQHAPVAAAAERRHGRDMLTHRKKTYKVILEEVKAERKKLITLVCLHLCRTRNCTAVLTIILAV